MPQKGWSESKQAQNQFAPIFEKDGNQFLVCHKSFAGTDDNEAWEIGLGASLVECFLWGAKFTGKTCEVTDDTRGYEAHLQGALVAIINGPLYDELVAMSAD